MGKRRRRHNSPQPGLSEQTREVEEPSACALRPERRTNSTCLRSGLLVTGDMTDGQRASTKQ